ncbi:hypothetical protein SYNPS1DRAFT_27300 [Syncephalis pseudoplumigaleata]|uniref:Uncharacterized protein n=1 Tax=Syncephalis pseudoplumigaleata TaxID=1712513 RepID=A0A4P9Z3N4_9FUNG|nr:hypothetical protein SYNPS1DRAFT_27300 [Syncephalis pseudoplumigaleata]|eukprot:RKP27035.1 hypothetical protein SYNPS1DRAFT_27300 [Syncephalis pseudoplumigaleata]
MKYNLSIPLTLLLAAGNGYGRPLDSQLVDDGAPCGIVDGIRYVCNPASQVMCTTMLGRTQSICARISDEGDRCDNDYTMCANHLTCNIQNGQLEGVCAAMALA